MSVVGLVLAIAPWIGGYAGDGAAWVSWIGGVALTLLAGAAYIADEAGAVTATERIKELAKYQAQHGISLHRCHNGPNSTRRLRRHRSVRRTILDRKYFHSIYLREPRDMLFKMATDSPGFTVDQTLMELRRALKLPRCGIGFHPGGQCYL